jgi:peptidoglycan/xylan/chitin deacetylase (PgdA/CDA1 family)
MILAAILALSTLQGWPIGLAGVAVHGSDSTTRDPRRPLTSVQTREREVAITFDACATRTHGYGFDRAIFDLIRREQLPVTVFVSGRWVELHPDAMDELAREPLIEFGDHSYDHPHMSRLPAAQIAEEIDRTETALGRYGRHGVAFRPPFGDWNDLVMQVVAQHHLPFVTWDVVSGDPSVRTTTSGMVQTVVKKARAGSIIIFHINGRGWKTAEALPTILQELRTRGFRFVPLSELMGTSSGVEQMRAPGSQAPAGGG